MVKKVLGGLFFAAALLVLIGAVANGTLFSDQGTAAQTYGRFVGTLLPVIIYVLSGIFLLAFDGPTKINYIDGFKKRSKQASECILFMVAYGVLVLFAAIGAGSSGADMLGCIIGILPYMVPVGIFFYLYQMYALTHNASKKYFVNSEAALQEYLSANETFYAWSNDNFVLASNKVLYFPQLFCVVPFQQISSLTFYKGFDEQGVYIHLANGKKIYIKTKHYDRIAEAVNAYAQVQQ